MRPAGIHSLADIGDWPRIEIGSHSVIRYAYENVLTACARLASFSTGGPTTTDGPISGQEEILEVDDLVSFAIHARRLIENTASRKRFKHVVIRSYNLRTIPITRVINVLVHHKEIEIIRGLFKLELVTGRLSPIDALIKYGTEKTRKYNKKFSPVVSITSDHGTTIALNIQQCIEVFQSKALNHILEICAEHGLYLDLDDEL
jgi:hypothetical protein